MNAIQRIWRDLLLLPIRDYQTIEGWLTKNEALALYRIAKGLPAGACVVEIGSWKGRSTFCIAKGLKDARLVAIDPFDASGETGSREVYAQGRGQQPLVEQFKRNLGQHGLLSKIEIKQGYSQDHVAGVLAVDFLFIDGDHSQAGCERDFNLFSPKVKPGGLLGFHDYDDQRPELGPTWVVENRLRQSADWSPAGRWDSLIVFRRV